MPSDRVAVRVPDPRVAPNYRWALEEYSAFEAEYIDPTVAMVAPREGAGVVRDFLELEFLCDRRTDLGAASTFTPVRERPPEQRYGIDTEAGRAALAQLGEGDERLEAVLAAIRVSTTLNAHSGTLEEFLRSQAGGNFETLPNSSYWYLSVDPVMLSRAAFFRSQLAMKLTPDLVDDAVERETLRGVTDLTLSKGVHYVDLVRPALLVSSPRFNGLLLPAMPHAVVMMTGEPLELRKPWPASAAQLFEPGLFNEAESRVEPLIAGLAPDDCNDLVGWWVKRLNVILSHAFDPTCWVREATDGAVPDAFVDVEAQTAWLVSIERLLADGLFLLSQPSAPALARVQAAFDLLDKAEALIGYGKDRSGEGFAALLRRRHSVRRINAAWQTMPPVLARRFTERTRSLFDSFYEQMRKDAAGPRLTAKGIKLAGRGGSKLEACSMDDYVAALCRAVRNSSHGLLRILTSDHDRYVLATHTGAMPRELTDIAVLVMFALVADAEKLCQGTWAYGLAD